MDDQRSCERRKKNKRCKQINIKIKENEKSTKILRRNKDASVHVAAFCVINIVVPSRRIQETSYWAAEAKTAQKKYPDFFGRWFHGLQCGRYSLSGPRRRVPFPLDANHPASRRLHFLWRFLFRFLLMPFYVSTLDS